MRIWPWHICEALDQLTDNIKHDIKWWKIPMANIQLQKSLLKYLGIVLLWKLYLYLDSFLSYINKSINPRKGMLPLHTHLHDEHMHAVMQTCANTHTNIYLYL